MVRRHLRSENLISLPRIFATLLIIGFTAEIIIMLVLPMLVPQATDGLGAFADATLLTLLSAPAIWHFVIRPLRRAALREKEQAAAVIAHAADAIMTLDTQNKILSCNPAGESIFGYPAREMVGQPLTLLIPELPETPAGTDPPPFRHQRLADDNAQPTAKRYLGRKKDGSRLTIELTARAVRLDRRKTLIAIVRDVTERRRAEEQLRKLNRAIEQSPSSVLITDASGRIEYVNPKFTEVTGYSAAEAIGKNPRILNSGRQPKEFYRDMWHTILQGREWRGEFCNRKKNGELYWEFSSISPIRNAAGQVTHFVSVKEDVTERKRTEEELQHAKEAAESANRAKSQFLASMSHELRTPLNGVLGYAQILQQKAASREQREYLNSIERCGVHLLTLINEVLDLSRIESGRLDVLTERCELSSLLIDVHDVVAPRAAEKNLPLLIDVAPQVPKFIWTDPVKLRQVLVNLLANALKFTDHGSVTLRIRCFDETAGQQLSFEVEDTGCGIPADRLANIFEPFSQVGDVSRAAGGTGLGLAISQRLAAALGGTLEVTSQVGQGSCFTLALPLLYGDNTHSPPPLRDTPAGQDDRVLAPGQELTVLVADDNPINRDLLVTLLHRSGIRTLQAADGEQAVAQLRTHHPQLALLDAHMPVMTGVEAVRMIRDDQDLRHTALIITSADVLTDFREQLGDFQLDDFISKPVRLPELLDKIARHAQVRFVRRNSPAAHAVPAADAPHLAAPLAQAIAARLRHAAEINSITELRALSAELNAQPEPANRVGEMIDELAQAFDFDGIARLADSLVATADLSSMAIEETT